MNTVSPKSMTRYKLRNGDLAEVYRAEGVQKKSHRLERQISALGATLIIVSQQGTELDEVWDGWVPLSWRADGSNTYGKEFDLVEELGPIPRGPTEAP